jgi:thiol:disulfide interchange protein
MRPSHTAPVPPTLRIVSLLLLALVALAVPVGTARAQEVEVRAVADRPQLAPGGKLVVAVVMDHGDELHSWPPAHVSLGDEKLNEQQSTVRTAIEPQGELPAGLRFIGVQWPTAVLHAVPSDGTTPAEAPVLVGKAVAFVVFEADATLKPGEVTIPIRYFGQPCDDKQCYMPKKLTLNVTVSVAATPSDARNEPSLFAGFDQGKVTPTATAPPSNPTPPAPLSNTPDTSSAAPAAPQNSFLGATIGSSAIVLFLLAILGGAVLNLTPCVLPIIPIKVMTLVQHAADSKQRRLYLGAWNALGVVAFWTAVGIPVFIARGATQSTFDPSQFIFGNWWVTFGLGLIMVAMGLGIMGLFTINLPQSVYLINPKADNAKGSFLFGVMTGVLGLPCFGFVAGGLLAAAATLPPIVILAIFVGMGLGMAAPYFVLAANPKLVSKLPRTGPASELVKQVLGFLLLAAAAFFIASGVQTLVSQRPWYAGSMQYWAAAAFVLIAALWLVLRTWQITVKRGRSVVLSILAIAAAYGAFAFARSSTEDDRKDYEARMAARATSNGPIPEGVWNEFDQALLEKARSENRVIFVDYTAPWCITCRVQKKAVLDRDPVRSRLDTTTLFHVNIDLPEGEKSLNSLGRTGIPTYAIYGPGLSEPVIINTATPQMVLDALDKAGSKPLTQR